MKNFNCEHCGHMVFFENTFCSQCGSVLGFVPDKKRLVTLTKGADGKLQEVARGHSGQQWRYCSNYQHGVCNWLVDVTSKATLCQACELNRHIPNLEKYQHKKAWGRLEYAKHRLIYTLLQLNLPVIPKLDDPNQGLAFDFISEEYVIPSNASSLTGHAQGQVTINAAEADNVEREQRRENMAEDYRTLIGHFRHEIGHYYWDLIIAKNEKWLTQFRQLFGDDRIHYKTALDKHYQNGPVARWSDSYISAYASSHPWEDWAETWAHYFHILETVDTGFAFQMAAISPQNTQSGKRVEINIDPFQPHRFGDVMDRFLAISLAINSVNRCMGQPDLYPFVHNQSVITKLEFIHTVIADYVAGKP